MSELVASNFNPYPVGYGVEEETAISYLPAGSPDGEALGNILRRYRQTHKDVLTVPNSTTGFDSSGGRLYLDNQHIEIATPEYPDIDGLCARVQSHELLIPAIVGAHLRTNRRRTIMGIHRRVVDSQGVTFGQHDSFGYHGLEALLPGIKTMLIGHLSARSFITGAGYVEEHRRNGLRFAQKAQHVSSLDTYAYGDSMYRMSASEGGVRIEVRCSDVNISPAAFRLRIGSSAIALAIGQTELSEGFERFVADLSPWPAKGPYLYNLLPMLPDGSFRSSPRLLEAIGFERRMYETFLSDKMKHVAPEPPQDLVEIAKKGIAFCDDAEKVAKNEASFVILKDRADWAAKMHIITGRAIKRPKYIDKQTGRTKRRTLTDHFAVADDIAYDFIRVSKDTSVSKQNPSIVVKPGVGYYIRDEKHGFVDALPPEAVTATYNRPPKTSRAGVRSFLIENYNVLGVDWKYVLLQHRNPRENPIRIDLDDVRTTALTDKQRSLLAYAQLR